MFPNKKRPDPAKAGPVFFAFSFRPGSSRQARVGREAADYWPQQSGVSGRSGAADMAGAADGAGSANVAGVADGGVFCSPSTDPTMLPKRMTAPRICRGRNGSWWKTTPLNAPKRDSEENRMAEGAGGVYLEK